MCRTGRETIILTIFFFFFFLGGGGGVGDKTHVLREDIKMIIVLAQSNYNHH